MGDGGVGERSAVTNRVFVSRRARYKIVVLSLSTSGVRFCYAVSKCVSKNCALATKGAFSMSGRSVPFLPDLTGSLTVGVQGSRRSPPRETPSRLFASFRDCCAAGAIPTRPTPVATAHPATTVRSRTRTRGRAETAPAPKTPATGWPTGAPRASAPETRPR
jgi:hypothetical protein